MEAQVGDIWKFMAEEDSYYLFLERLPLPDDYRKVYDGEELWLTVHLNDGMMEPSYWWPNPDQYVWVA